MTRKRFARALTVVAAVLVAAIVSLGVGARTARASEIESRTNMGFEFHFADSDAQIHQRPDFHMTLLARVERTRGEASLGADAESLFAWQPAAKLLSAFGYQMSDEDAKLAEDYVVAANGEDDIKTLDIIKDLPLWFKSDGVEYGIEYTFVLTTQVYQDGTTVEFNREEGHGGFDYDDPEGCYMAMDFRTDGPKYYETVFYFMPKDGAKSIDLNVAYNDTSNAYGTRPESMEFALQRSCDGGQTWEYLTAHGSKFEGLFADASGTLNSNIVTINASDWAEVRRLPFHVPGDSTKTCTYRAVEVLRGKSYQVSNNCAEVIDVSEDGSTQVVATPMTEEGGYCHCAFTNSLAYTGSTGYVSFEGVNPYEFRPVTLTLQCSVDGQTWTDVANAPTPVIINSPMEKKFFIFYMNIPKYDAEDNTYAYRVVQDPLEGFSTTYYTSGGDVTDAIYQEGIARNVLN